jgi:hypothetical protein
MLQETILLSVALFITFCKGCLLKSWSLIDKHMT